MSTDEKTPAPRDASLWRYRDFRLLWAGHTVSMLGSQITLVALPLLAALTLHATPAQMATLQALQYAPPTLVSLFAGVLVDRVRRRPLMIVTDLISALLLLMLPVSLAAGWLQLELLYAVALLLGIVGVFYGLADAAFLPTLVPRAQLPAANGALATSSSTTRVVGPGLAGVLIQWLGAPLAVLLDAASFLISAMSALLIRTPEPAPAAPAQRSNVWAEIAEGLATVVRNPYLRAFALAAGAFDLFWNALYAVYILYVTRTLGLPPAAVGLILSVGSVVALICAPGAAGVARRFGLGRTLVASQALLGAGSVLIALALAAPPFALVLLLTAEAIQAGANTVSWVTRDSVRQAVTPDHLRGRAGAATMCLGFGAALLGTILGGVLGERAGVAATVAIGALGGLTSFVWLLRSPVAALQTIDDVASEPFAPSGKP
jgi:MFS family permease